MAKGYNKPGFIKRPPSQLPLLTSDVDERELGPTRGPNQNPRGTQNFLMADSTTAANTEDEVNVPQDLTSQSLGWAQFLKELIKGDFDVSPRFVTLLTIIGWAVACIWALLLNIPDGQLSSFNGLISYGNQVLIITAIIVILFFFLTILSLVNQFIRNRKAKSKLEQSVK